MLLECGFIQGGILMQAPSLDLRKRIAEAYEAGEGSYATIAKRFSVGPTVVGNFVR